MTQKRGQRATSPHHKGGPVAERIAARVTEWVGSSKGMTAAVAVIVVWAAVGPIFGWSDTWQLAINTGTTIVTFLMVFLIQNTQNRDARAIHLKLDELIRAHQDARNGIADIEDASDAELERLQEEFAALRNHYAEREERIRSRRT